MLTSGEINFSPWLKRRINFHAPMQIIELWGHIYREFYLNLIVFALLKKLGLSSEMLKGPMKLKSAPKEWNISPFSFTGSYHESHSSATSGSCKLLCEHCPFSVQVYREGIFLTIHSFEWCRTIEDMCLLKPKAHQKVHW